MDAVLRALAIYAFLMLVFRATGKRSLSQITTFDFVLLLIIGEATQQALLGDDFSITTALLVVTTIVLVDILLSLLQRKFPQLGPALEDVPLILVDNGKIIRRHLDKSRITEDDILESAREKQGLERMDQVKFAVLERTGSISIIPRSDSA